MAQITLKNICKEYGDGFKAVNDISLDIADGEFMILVGPSGCGKSTTLRMVVGLEDITSGDLEIDGRRVNDLAPKDRNLAMVFQNYALYPHLSVRDNIAFPLRLGHNRIPEEEVDRRVREAAEMLELTEHLDRRPANLSGGQRQRVAPGPWPTTPRCCSATRPPAPWTRRPPAASSTCSADSTPRPD